MNKISQNRRVWQSLGGLSGEKQADKGKKKWLKVEKDQIVASETKPTLQDKEKLAENLKVLFAEAGEAKEGSFGERTFKKLEKKFNISDPKQMKDISIEDIEGVLTASQGGAAMECMEQVCPDHLKFFGLDKKDKALKAFLGDKMKEAGVVDKQEMLEYMMGVVGVELSKPRFNYDVYLGEYMVKRESELLTEVGIDSSKTADQIEVALQSVSEGKYPKYVVDKLRMQAKAYKAMAASGKFEGIPFKDAWRFLVDGTAQREWEKLGSYVFEDEPGYILSMLEAMTYGLDTQDPVSKDMIFKTHELCTKYLNLSNPMQGAPKLEKVKQGLRTAETSFGLNKEYFELSNSDDVRSLQEALLVDIQNMKYDPWFKAFHPTLRTEMYTLENIVEVGEVAEDAGEKRMEGIIEQHSKALDNAQNKDERLRAHLGFVRQLELSHFFNDCNTRTEMMVFMRLIRDDAELGPVMWENPNVFSASVKRIEDVAIEGAKKVDEYRS